MYFMYVDESGSSGFADKSRRFLALTGVVIKDNYLHHIEGSIHAIKKEIVGNTNIELKSNAIRRRTGPFRRLSQKRWQHLLDSINKLFKNSKLILIASVIDVPRYKKKSFKHPKVPFEKAYEFLVERYDQFLEAQKDLGVIVLDTRTGKLSQEIRYGDKDIRVRLLHNKLRFKKRFIGKKIRRVVGEVFFVSSLFSFGVQLADLAAYPFFYRFEYDKPDYELFKVLMEKIYKGKTGKNLDAGLKIYPKK